MNNFEGNVDCHYKYDGCTGEATTGFHRDGSFGSEMEAYYECCENCLAIRQVKEKEIQDRYGSGLQPFSGANEYGEYYDEEDY